MDKRDYQSLVKIPKHPGFFHNPESKKIYWRGTIQGRTFKRSTGVTQITKAKRVIDEFILSLTSENLDRAQREKRGVVNPSLKVLWDEMIEARKADKSDTTVKIYEKEWRLRFEPFMKNHNLSQVGSKWVVKFENWFLKEFPNRSYFQTGKYLQMFLNYLHQEGYVTKKYKTRNLDKHIGRKLKKKKAYRVYTPAEQQALEDGINKAFVRAAIFLYFDTGARKIEGILMHSGDVIVFGESGEKIKSEWD